MKGIQYSDIFNISTPNFVDIALLKKLSRLKNSLVLNANELDSMLKVQVGDNAIVDIFLKSLKGGDANGNVKVNLKDLLTVNGQLKANKGKGTANLVLDFVKVPNKVKLDSSFNIAAPTFDIDVTLYPQFEKDNNKKVVLSTHNKVSENAIESKQVQYQHQNRQTLRLV